MLPIFEKGVVDILNHYLYELMDEFTLYKIREDIQRYTGPGARVTCKMVQERGVLEVMAGEKVIFTVDL